MPAIPVDELDEHSRWLYYAHGTHLNTVTEEHVRNARHAYYGMCTYIDDKVGRIMDAMRATGHDRFLRLVSAGGCRRGSAA